MNPDIVNGALELAGGLFTWMNVRQILKDKMVRGIAWYSVLFFWAWSLWNIYWYHSLETPWSLAGAVWMLVANSTWLALLIRYRQA